MARPVAVVTGANRGLGLETCRQLLRLGWDVVVCARDPGRGETAAAELAAVDREAAILAVPLDVTSSAQAVAAAAAVAGRFGRTDCLVNNAGAVFEDRKRSGVLQVDPDVAAGSVANNAVGALRVTQAFADLLLASGGAIVNVSSGMGGIAEMDGGYPGYRMSKASMNALTRILHAELSGRGIRVNSVCPGWVRTEMGGPGATRSVPEGAASIVATVEATRAGGGPSGGFFRDGRPIAW